MQQNFDGQVALVTGAGSGIGLAIATAFAKAGASVVLADRDKTSVRSAEDALASTGHPVLAVDCDVADEGQVAGLVQQAVSAFGRLDAACNNAGIHVPRAETADAVGNEFDRAIAVNLRGVWNCMKYELLQMRGQGRGAIVNVSSQSGIVGIPGLGAYTASKHGVVGLTKAAALEYASTGIRINALCPGSVQTPMVDHALQSHPDAMTQVIRDIPMGRLGRAEEIASAALWLCSEGASFVIGHALVADGGYTAR
jgi:NAD(P)-dependent dehydrogenase (short-subunit alcohol dehydrogenase family)